MFSLGILSFLQIVLLPGVLILRILRFKGGIIHTLALAFGLSLLANYIVVTLLALVGLYRQGVVLALVGVEVLALAWLFLPEWKTPLGRVVKAAWQDISGFFQRLAPHIEGRDENETVMNAVRLVILLVFFLMAVSSVLWMVQVFQLNLGTVFNTWDAVVSWNRWAVSWAGNHFPLDTGYYPQLLPANWSLTYVMTGSTQVQFFAKATAPLFFLFTLLLLFDLGLDARSSGIFLGVTLVRLVTKKFAGEFIAEGYADLPAAFLAFLSVYLLLKIQANLDPTQRRRAIWLAGFMGAAATVTKQSGGFVFASLPLLAYLLVARNMPDEKAWRKWLTALLPCAVAAIIPLAWYAFKFINIAQGLDSSNVQWLISGIFHGLSLPERGVQAFQSLEKYAYMILFTIPALLVIKPAYRWLVLLVVLPISLLWAFLFSYDTRNIAVTLPFLGLTAGLGVEGFLEVGLGWLQRLRPARLAVAAFLAVVILIIAAASFLWLAAAIEQRQVELQKQIFSPGLNAQLYAYIEENGLDSKILTDYPIAYLPGLEDAQLQYSFNDLTSFLELQNRPEVGFILLPVNVAGEIKQAVEERLANGDYQQVFEDNGFIPHRFIRILKKQH